MITIKKRGIYSLFKTKNQTKILILDHIKYAWIDTGKANELFITSREKSIDDHLLYKGNYRVYNVIEEKGLSEHTHLELCVGNGRWHGYLLPEGIPTEKGKSSYIIPTKEIITHPIEVGYPQASLGY